MAALDWRMPAAAGLIVVALAGCGGSASPGVTPAAYVHAVCGTVYPYDRSVVVSGATLQAGLYAVKTPVQAKRLLEAYIKTVSDDTDAAVSRLKAAGSPAVKNGQRISSAFLDAFLQVQSAIHQALAEVTTLPTASLSAFRGGIQTLEARLGSIRSVSQRLQSGTLNSPELHKAAAKDPACQNLG